MPDNPTLSERLRKALGNYSDTSAWLRLNGAEILQALDDNERPIDMLLRCPYCGFQHVDALDVRTPDWTNPPHRSHLCHECQHVWRPCDRPTNGVKTIATKGEKDSAAIPLKWTYDLLLQYVHDSTDGFECLPNCDSYGHEELCPLTNAVAAFRQLADDNERYRATIVQLEKERAEAVEQLRSAVAQIRT